MLAREALDELRSLILGLRPPDLERDGLEGALRKEIEMLGRVHGVGVELSSEGAVAPAGGAEGDRERDFAVLRIVGEALHNALHHAQAKHVTVRLGHSSTGSVVEVRDDGIGFDPERPEVRSRHLGLTSMEERARELGGRLEIHSAPGAGTTVRLELVADGSTRSGYCWSMIMRWSVRDCERSSSSRTGSRSRAKRRTANRR